MNGILGGLPSPPPVSRKVINAVRNVRVVQTIVELASLTAAGRKTGPWLSKRLTTHGASGIKIGQFLATRGDVYGQDFADALQSLNSDVITVSRGREARRMLRASLGPKTMSLFSQIDDEPISAASIAQVHRGTLKDGRNVVIKVLRTDVREDIMGDMAFLLGITRIADWITKSIDAPEDVRLLVKKAKETVKNIDGYLHEELDLLAEAKNLLDFYDIYRGSHTVRVPRLVKEACNHTALVMEDLPSRNVIEVAKKTTAYEDRRYFANLVMQTFLRQLLNHCIVHGDPHAGNMGVHANGKLVLYDFGSIVRIEKDDVLHLTELLAAMLFDDVPLAVSALKQIGAEIKDEDALKTYVGFYRQYMKTLDFGAMVESAKVQMEGGGPTKSSSSSPVPPKKGTAGVAVPAVLPSRIGRIVRSFALIEGICKRIDPTFNYFDALLDGGPDSLIVEILLKQNYIRYKIQSDPVVLERRAIQSLSMLFAR
jgi:predicted unusual protein kinase regulating ubiquinone biosynthesis (AarF/ABC1/UbiB family)